MELRIVPERSVLHVEARAPLHSTHAQGRGLSGTVSFDPADVAGSLKLEVSVAIAEIRSGDSLLDSKSLRHVEAARYPTARFVLDRASGQPPALRVEGKISWRDEVVPVSVTTKTEVGATEARGHAAFELDMRRFGLVAPKLLFLKVQDVVKLEVEIVAVPG